MSLSNHPDFFNFVYGSVGALFGAGAVYGRMASRITALEDANEQAQTERLQTATALSLKIESLQTEIKIDLREMARDLKHDMQLMLRRED